MDTKIGGLIAFQGSNSLPGCSQGQLQDNATAGTNIVRLLLISSGVVTVLNPNNVIQRLLASNASPTNIL